MTIVGASRETGSLQDDVQREQKHLQNSENDVIISSSTEPQTSTCGHSSQPCSECSIASASAAADQNKAADEPLLPKGNGGGTLSSDMMQTEAEIEDEDDGVPYDRGWAWMVVLGQFVHFVLMAGFIKSGGLIFVELLKTFQASATHTAMFFALTAGVYSFSGFYVMNVLFDQFGTRKLGLVGAVLMSLSAILSSLADDLMLLICVHSILLGYIRDVTGSYAMAYHVIGTGILVAGTIQGMDRPVRRCLEKRQQRRQSQQQQQLKNSVP